MGRVPLSRCACQPWWRQRRRQSDARWLDAPHPYRGCPGFTDSPRHVSVVSTHLTRTDRAAALEWARRSPMANVTRPLALVIQDEGARYHRGDRVKLVRTPSTLAQEHLVHDAL